MHPVSYKGKKYNLLFIIKTKSPVYVLIGDNYKIVECKAEEINT